MRTVMVMTDVPAPTAGLLDLTGLSLRDLVALDDRVLDAALRRAVEAVTGDGPQRSVSAFNSAV